MAPAQTKNKASRTNPTGAPLQAKQSSRKGKKAWRKNVDISEIESGLEELREQEKTGGVLHRKQNEELFVIDTEGDEQVKRRVRSSKPLKSTEILAQRSSVPAIAGRARSTLNVPSRSSATSTTTGNQKAKLSKAMQKRLQRTAHKVVKGPFGAVVEEENAHSTRAEVTEAIRRAGTYDVWADSEEGSETKETPSSKKAGKRKAEPDNFIEELVRKKTVKPPASLMRDGRLAIPAVSVPHPGQSYNPEVEAHNELIDKVYRGEKLKDDEAERLAQLKAEWEKRGKRAREEEKEEDGIARAGGMRVDMPTEVEEDESEAGQDEDKTSGQKKEMRRKTKAERARRRRAAEELRALAERRRKKSLNASISQLPSISKTLQKTLSARAEAMAARKREKAERLERQGIVGEKIGKYTVQEPRQDVQLGDELSESLRGLKTEGNLFRDRFVSMQQRALAEPRVPVVPPRRKTKLKEYEKHAWKRFE